LRLDHPDGLFDPAAYFEKLQRAAGGISPLHLLAEKILAVDEHLPESWPISGTTGYGFLNGVNGLFVDRSNRQALERLYARVSGRRDPVPEVAYQAKRLIMASSMASELAVLTRALKRIASSHRATRDYTMNALRKTLIETVACMPVYRTYVNDDGFSAHDREVIDFAIDHARRRNPVLPSALFLFVRNVLVGGSAPADGDPAHELAMRRTFAMKFQQFSAPVQAKGVEDTAFYRHNTLVSLNEVGGDPGLFGGSLDEFHAANRVRLEHWPLEMTTTATHDTKRGEDTRARIDVISELPSEWRHAVLQWTTINAPRRTVVDRGPAPDRNDEYLFYQSLLGVWPAEAIDAPLPEEAPPPLVTRVRQYMQKAIKEAKVHTSWISQDTAYEDGVVRFVDAVLSGPSARAFLASFVPFARRVAVAGAVNSLAQLVLKIASPGVPDFYQGTETWQLVLADPDNRRDVDYAERQGVLDGLMPWVERAEAARAGRDIEGQPLVARLEPCVESWLLHWTDGRIKTFLTACGLRLRREARELFVHGRYEPLAAEGPLADRVVSFARVSDTHNVVAIVPRLMSRAVHDIPRFAAGVWGDTRVAVPATITDGKLIHAFTGARVPIVREGRGASVRAADAFRTCPVALLVPGR
jgi:(1->4)-alpha-D-glucan 1-alpha-D-glucosylmutase